MTHTFTRPTAAAWVNNIDVEAIRALRRVASSTEATEVASWLTSTRWEPGCDGRALYGDAEGDGDSEPSPQELLLGVINSCLLLGTRIRCALEGIQLDMLEVTSTAETDLRAMVGLPEPSPGLRNITVVIVVESYAAEGRLKELGQETLLGSPVLATLGGSARIDGNVVVVR
ncbi:OsmC family protein [Caulobacter sp. KR2-114]|uniref:OsmC family protein n=1 Tax=Caulobacter sp. KR2-114 TaxID=3400912 RepID=UPI003C121BEB